jgi:hypothetical protein
MERNDAYRCFAHSRPKPVFAPVTMIVFPAKSMSGTYVLPNAWPRSILAISLKGAMVKYRSKELLLSLSE